MDFNALGIPVAFVLLSAMGLWLLIFAKGHWLLKIAFITFSLYFGLAMWFSLSELSGWPTNSELPQKFLVKGVLVTEPSRTITSDLGAIYVWVIEIDEEYKAKKKEPAQWMLPFVSKKRAVEPRAYRLPYSEELKKKASQVSKMLKEGKQVVGEKSDLEGKGDGDGDGKGKGKGKGKSKGEGEGEYGGKGQGKELGKGKGKGNSLSQQQDYMFYELPPPKMPDK